jgi:hypothetical protein
MRMLFTGTGQPFYAQADLVDVPPLGLAALLDIVDAGFDGHPPAGLAAQIHAFTGGHPQRSMQLADAAWTAVQEGVPEAEVWVTALERCRLATADSHEIRFSGLPAAEQAVVRLAATSGALFGRDAQLLSLSRSSAQHARDHLVTQGQIEITDAGAVVIDPLYADWIRQRFAI